MIKPFTDRNLKLTKWFVFKHWIKWKFSELTGLFPGQSIWNKLYEDWRPKISALDLSPEIIDLISILTEVRMETHKQSLRGGPHVIILRNKAAKLFKEYEKLNYEYLIKNRSYLQKLFQVEPINDLRNRWNVVIIDVPTFSKENPTSIFDIEAIHFMGNLKHEKVNDGKSFINIDEEKQEIPSINLYFVTEKQPDIIIKRNL